MAIVSFKADLLYGASDTTKTSNIGRVAEWFYKRTGKTSRLISADGGGWEPIDPLVQAKIVEPWPVRLRDHKIETVDKACQGYWPEDPSNPRSPLQPPSIINYTAICYRCRGVDAAKALLYGPSQVAPKQLICPHCKAVVGPRDIDVHVIAQHDFNPKNDMRNIALIGIEGLTSLGDTMMEFLQHEKASLSQDPSYTYVDGDSSYSGGNMSYYGFVQARLYEFVHKSHMIPFVDKVIWTALEGKGEEEATKIPIFGPAIVGKKATGKASAWFGNTLHFESVETTTAGKDANEQVKVSSKKVMYLRTHADPTSKVPFQAKTRAPYQYAHELPDFMDADVSKLYDKLEELKAKATANLQQLIASKPQQPKSQ